MRLSVVVSKTTIKESLTMQCLRAALIVSLIVSAFASKEIVMHTKMPLNCLASWNTSASSMYNVAFKWTHEHRLKSWQYRIIDPPSFPTITVNTPASPPRIPPSIKDIECAQISYAAAVQVPGRFSSYLPKRVLDTNISKIVCASKEHMNEVVTFSNIMFVGDISLQFESTIDNSKREVVFDTTGDMSFPWFAVPLKQFILIHLQRSILEYINLLVDSLCAETVA